MNLTKRVLVLSTLPEITAGVTKMAILVAFSISLLLVLYSCSPKLYENLDLSQFEGLPNNSEMELRGKGIFFRTNLMTDSSRVITCIFESDSLVCNKDMFELNKEDLLRMAKATGSLGVVRVRYRNECFRFYRDDYHGVSYGGECRDDKFLGENWWKMK